MSNERYNKEVMCEFCGKTFLTKPRFVKFCSQSCKNPTNRKGNVPWNKGKTMTEEQKAKMDMSGLAKGHGWQKGLKNPSQSTRWTGEGNPNWEGKMNNARPKKPRDERYLNYRAECKKCTYRTLYKLRKDGNMPVTGKRKHDLQVDHIIPYRQGYEMGLDPLVVGSIYNLQFLTGEQNRAKWEEFQDIELVENIIRMVNEDGILEKGARSLRESS